MIVIDPSALVAILKAEPRADDLISVLVNADVRVMSAASLLECNIVVFARWGAAGLEKLEELIKEAGIEVIPFTEQHSRVALDGFKKFGKGQNSAGLNYGDCISYSLAKTAKAPLLFVGDNFSKTDLTAAIPVT